MRKLSGKGTEVVDLRGRFVAPGFIDGHLHLLGGSLSLEELRLDDAETFAALTQRVRDWAAAHPDAHWVTGEGWTYAAFPDGLPSRAPARRVVPGPPGLARLLRRPHRLGQLDGAAPRRASPARRRTRRAARSCATRRASPPASLKESAMDLVGRLVPKLLPHEKERALRQGDRPGRGLGPHERAPGRHRRGGAGDPRARARGRPAAARLRRPSTWSATRPPRPSPGRTSCGAASPRTACAWAR